MPKERKNSNAAPLQQTTPISLLEGISEAKTTVDLLLDNKFEEAKSRLKNSGSVGMYQEMSHATILFVQGTATIEHEHLVSATEYIKNSLIACNASRRKAGFGESITRQSGKRQIALYQEFTEEQAHAELCYAEGLLQFAFLNMLQDEKLTCLIRNSLKIGQCYKRYRLCSKILKYRNWSDGISKSAFESGVRLGVGSFNLMISMLPRRVLKLLEFVGFSGDRKLGLEQLRIGAQMGDSLRAPLCAILLLVFHLYATQMLGDSVSSVCFEQPEYLMEAKELLRHWRSIYPKSAIFLLLAGRAQALSGDLQQAIDYFEQSINTPLDWTHYKHICYWELMWCHALRAEWKEAVRYAERLACESQWSQATYRYMNAAFLLQYLDDPGASTPKQDSKSNHFFTSNKREEREQILQKIDALLMEIPKLMQRFAGRSLPLEKIALRRSKRYYEQNKRLTLPALELIYIWNGFKLIQSQTDCTTTFLSLCENKLNELHQYKDRNQHYYDEYCLAMMLKGVCQRCRGMNKQAEATFETLISCRDKLKSDKYVLPYSEIELCQLYLETGDTKLAMMHLERASKYKGYNLESRLHFRIHELESRLNAVTQQGKNNQKQPTGSEQKLSQLTKKHNDSSQSIGATSITRGNPLEDDESGLDVTGPSKLVPPELEDDEFGDLDLDSEESVDF